LIGVTVLLLYIAQIIIRNTNVFKTQKNAFFRGKRLKFSGMAENVLNAALGVTDDVVSMLHVNLFNNSFFVLIVVAE
jgi:hypothetical protein